MWFSILFLKSRLECFCRSVLRCLEWIWFGLFRVYLRFMGFVEARALLERILCEERGYVRLVYVGYDCFREFLVKRGARVVRVEVDDSEDSYPSEFCVLVLGDRRIELFWKFKVVESTYVSWCRVT